MSLAPFRAQWPENHTEAGCDGDAPDGLAAVLEEAMAQFERNMDPTRNQDGNVWECETQRCADALQVHHSKAKGSQAWRIRVSDRCDNATPRMVYEQLGINEQKLTWDKESVGWAIRFKCFKGEQPGERIDIEAFISLPHLGGLVKPRSFLDARLTRFREDGTILSAVVPVDASAPWAAACGAPAFDALAKKAGLPRGRNLPGSGMMFAPEAGGCRFTMLMHTELGGWLPVGPVNNAGGEVLSGIAKQCRAVVAALPRPAAGTPPSGSEATPGPVTPVSSDVARAAGRRVRRRIRPPGCREEAAYGWRWLTLEVAAEAAA